MGLVLKMQINLETENREKIQKIKKLKNLKLGNSSVAKLKVNYDLC